MNLLNQIAINRPQRSNAVIQLLQGDLSAIPKEQAADILIISAYPGNYTPLPGTLIAALYEKGIDVAALARNKATDLRNEMGCWLSKPLSKQQQDQVNFKQILCFEPRAQIADDTSEQEIVQQPSADSSGEWWNMMAVKSKSENAGLLFRYTTGAGEEDIWVQSGGARLAEMLIKEKLASSVWDKTTAISIFELMIPAAFKEAMNQAQNISWLVDKETAAWPWELLLGNTDDAPLCIRGGMIRQLATPVRRRSAATTGNGKALIIGDPNLNGFINQLPAATEEARQTEKRLLENKYTCTTVLNAPADQIVLQLFSGDYTLLHFSGHGVFNAGEPEKSGLLIGKGIFLTAAEIEQLNKLPELIFISIGMQTETESLPSAYYENRNKLAAVVGTQLIQLGVKALVITGWATDDSAALAFTETFYDQMLNGAAFWKATQQARKKLYDNYGHCNTWGAYQCYGDPFYTLVSKTFEQEQVVGNIFQCINTFAFAENNNVIAMPVLASGNQGVPLEKMLPAMIDASIFWLSKGLPLNSINLVLLSDANARKALPIFNRAKEQNELKQGVISGAITGAEAYEKYETIKQQQLPGEATLSIVSAEIMDLARQDGAATNPLPQPARGTLPPLPAAVAENVPPPATDNGYDYFISYAHKHGTIVDEFVNKLKGGNNKLNIFYDKTDIEPGGLWIKNISDAIEKSKKVVVFLSPDYNSSKICWTEYQCAQLKEFNGNENVIVTIYLYSMQIPLIMGIRSFINCREADILELEKAAATLSKL